MHILQDGHTYHVWAGTESAPGSYVGSAVVHPNEGPVTSDELLARLGVRVTHFEYDFDDDAGAIGGLYVGDEIPSGARVLGGVYKVDTTFTTAGADAGTIALGIEAAGDLVTAIAVSDASNPWDAATPVQLLASTKDTVALTANRRPRIDFAGQAVTAGKLRGYLLWTAAPAVASAAVA